MKVIRAEAMGMCFGVRDALAVIDALMQPETVTIHGELVHNEVVLTQLGVRGFRMTAEGDRGRLPGTEAVLITAHGVSDRERRRLAAAGKRLIDTTCPLVERVHEAALKLQADGFHVLLIGRRGHVEVQGVIEDLAGCDVIQDAAEVRTYSYPRLGIVCQTTATAGQVASIRAAAAARNPHALIRFADTVCLPTKERQRALDQLVEAADVIVVVGGRNSNNTRALVDYCRRRGVPAHHIQQAADLDPSWFQPGQTVGLTAGTSTLPPTLEEVYDVLTSMPE